MTRKTYALTDSSVEAALWRAKRYRDQGSLQTPVSCATRAARDRDVLAIALHVYMQSVARMTTLAAPTRRR